jgi:hypothetical protein
MNFLNQTSKYILLVSVLLNGILIMSVVGMTHFFLYLSIIINFILTWYSFKCLLKVNDLENDLINLFQKNEDFLDNLENVHSLEMYYGDEYLQSLIDQSRELVNHFIDTQEKYFDVQIEDTEYDEEETTPSEKE